MRASGRRRSRRQRRSNHGPTDNAAVRQRARAPRAAFFGGVRALPTTPDPNKGRRMTTRTDTGSKAKGSITRRSFLKTSAGTAALVAAAQAQFPFGAYVAQAAGPEVKKATLGF